MEALPQPFRALQNPSLALPESRFLGLKRVRNIGPPLPWNREAFAAPEILVG